MRKNQDHSVDGWKLVRLEAIRESRAADRAAIKTSLHLHFSQTHTQHEGSQLPHVCHVVNIHHRSYLRLEAVMKEKD